MEKSIDSVNNATPPLQMSGWVAPAGCYQLTPRLVGFSLALIWNRALKAFWIDPTSLPRQALPWSLLIVSIQSSSGCCVEQRAFASGLLGFQFGMGALGLFQLRWLGAMNGVGKAIVLGGCTLPFSWIAIFLWCRGKGESADLNKDKVVLFEKAKANLERELVALESQSLKSAASMSREEVFSQLEHLEQNLYELEKLLGNLNGYGPKELSEHFELELRHVKSQLIYHQAKAELQLRRDVVEASMDVMGGKDSALYKDIINSIDDSIVEIDQIKARFVKTFEEHRNSDEKDVCMLLKEIFKCTVLLSTFETKDDIIELRQDVIEARNDRKKPKRDILHRLFFLGALTLKDLERFLLSDQDGSREPGRLDRVEVGESIIRESEILNCLEMQEQALTPGGEKALKNALKRLDDILNRLDCSKGTVGRSSCQLGGLHKAKDINNLLLLSYRKTADLYFNSVLKEKEEALQVALEWKESLEKDAEDQLHDVEEVKQLEFKCKRIEQELRAAKDDNHRLSVANRVFENNKKDVSMEISRAGKEAEQLRAVLEKEKENAEDIIKENKRLREEVKSLENNLREKIDQAREEAADSKEENDRLKEEIENLKKNRGSWLPFGK